MRSLTLNRSFYTNPKVGVGFVFAIFLFFEIISWAIAPQTKHDIYVTYFTFFSYLKNFMVGLLIPELFTLYILSFLIDIYHRFWGIRKINFNALSILWYELKFLPLFFTAFFLFFPVTLHVRFLLREFPHYSFNRYLDLYILHGFTSATYLLYLPFIIILGYILLNVSLVRDFLQINAFTPTHSQKQAITLRRHSSPAATIIKETIAPPAPPKSVAEAVPAAESESFTTFSINTPITVNSPASADKYIKFIDGKATTGEAFLRIDDCYFFETVEEKYFVEHPKGRFQVSKPLSVLELELDPIHFFRIHRSCIINMNHLNSYTYWEKGKYLVYVKGTNQARELVMPRTRLDAFKKSLSENRSLPSKQL